MDSKISEFLFLTKKNSKIRQIGSRPSKQQNFTHRETICSVLIGALYCITNLLTHIGYMSHLELQVQFAIKMQMCIFMTQCSFIRANYFSLTHMRERS